MNAFINPFTIGAAVLTITLITAFVKLRPRRDRSADLGEVSSQWVMEHRSNAGQDSSRWNQR